MTMYDDSRVVALLREIDPPLDRPDRLTEVRRRAQRSESRRATALAGVMAVVLAAGVVSVFNLGNRGKTETLSVAGAANATQAAGSARMSLEMSLKDSKQSRLLPNGPVIKATGLADFVHNRYSLKGTSNGQEIETRIIGRDRWTRIPTAVGFGNVAGKPWIHSVEKSPEAAAGLFSGPDPTTVLDTLRSKGTVLSSKKVGDRTRTVLRLPADAFGTRSSTLKQADADVTVETDSDERIRVLSTEIEAPELGTLKMTFRYDDFGIEVDVQPPPADQVQESNSASSSQSFSTTTGNAAPADEKTCEQIRQFLKNRPAPRSEQERQQQRQFEDIANQACPRK